MFVPSPSSQPPAGAVPVAAGPRVWRLPAWDRMSNAARTAELGRIGREAGADPRLRRLAVAIFRAAGVAPRDYRGQAAAILACLQKKVYFLNEKDEVLQDPAYTLDLQPDGSIGPRAHGDCDDLCMAFLAICEAIHLPARAVTSGMLRGRPVRYVEGRGRCPAGVKWEHAYALVRLHPFRGAPEAFADATVPGAPLGWDVVARGGSDPQRGYGDGGGVAALPGEERVSGMSLGTAASLVGVSVMSAFVVRKLEKAGWI